jgi:phosphoribosyl 1,2-cyclic phosphate phosphodiesterase
MELIILGSGGATPTPKPFCQCSSCKKARRLGEPYKRNGSSLFIEDINGVIDCGEDIGDSLNRRSIKQIDNLFITHWHPDHTFGLRSVLQANFNFLKNKNEHPINIYIPKKSYEILMEKFAAIDYFINVQKAGILHLVDDGDNFQLGDIKISVVGYVGKGSDTCAYLIEHKGKKAIYSPCDTISFEQHKKFNDLDLLITECGAFSYVPDEISFKDMINRLREIKPKKTIITHIEEIELNTWGEKHFNDMKKHYKDVKFDYAYDGMKIKL